MLLYARDAKTILEMHQSWKQFPKAQWPHCLSVASCAMNYPSILPINSSFTLKIHWVGLLVLANTIIPNNTNLLRILLTPLFSRQENQGSKNSEISNGPKISQVPMSKNQHLTSELSDSSAGLLYQFSSDLDWLNYSLLVCNFKINK